MKKFVTVSQDLLGAKVTSIYFYGDQLVMSFDNNQYICFESDYNSISLEQSEIDLGNLIRYGLEAGILTKEEAEEMEEARRLEDEKRCERVARREKEWELAEYNRLKAKFENKGE